MGGIGMRWLSAGLMCVAAAVQAAPVATPQEFKAMEPACQAIGMGEIDGVFWAEALNRPDRKGVLDKPENAMANGAVWFHHYCWGKLAKHRFFTEKTSEKRNFQTKTWRGEMQYIIDWTRQKNIDWAYLPQIHKEIAESYLFEKRYPQAIQAAELALQKRRSFAGAYLIIADAYEAMKNQPKALHYATEGLKHNPETRALQKRYLRLGGKKPYPEAYPADTAPSTATPEPTPPTNQEVASPIPGAPSASSPAVPDIAPTTETSQPKNNPYCRFCP